MIFLTPVILSVIRSQNFPDIIHVIFGKFFPEFSKNFTDLNDVLFLPYD
jgi:hypothetical protein